MLPAIFGAAFGATIYIGADGKFYNAVSGGSEVSYTTGDAFNFQTGVTSWNIAQNISGGGGIYVNTKTIAIDGAYTAALGGITTGGTTATGPAISLLNGASMTLGYVNASSNTFKSVSLQGTSSAQTTLTLTGYLTTSYLSIESLSVGEYSTLNVANAFIVPTSMTVSAHATVNIGCLQITGGTFTSNADTGSITVTNSSINMMAGSKLVLNTSNAIKLSGAGKSQADLILAVARNTATLELGADQAFNKLSFSFGGSVPSVQMTIDTNGYALDFTSTTSSFTTTKTALTVLIEDFTDGKVHFGTMLDTNEDGTVKYIYAVIDAVQTQLYQRENGYLYTTVPEPAEWAAIFGALALGLAIYRRRGNRQ